MLGVMACIVLLWSVPAGGFSYFDCGVALIQRGHGIRYGAVRDNGLEDSTPGEPPRQCGTGVQGQYSFLSYGQHTLGGLFIIFKTLS
jgi:hypothetical protein